MANINKLIKVCIGLVLVFPTLVFNNVALSPKPGQNDQQYFTGFYVSAAEQKNKRKTRKTPALRERIYSQLARAQKLADEKNVAAGIAILDRVKSRIEQLNSYEKAMLWNFYGFIYYGKNDTQSAIDSFKKVVEQKNIPESLELSTLFSLAQLQMVAEKYQGAINYLDRWQVVKGGALNDNGLILKANALYAMKQYAKAESAISAAVDNAFKQNKLPKENWLVLKRALHYELKQIGQVTKVSEQLVRHYSKASYWIDLANMYGETEQVERQLSVMEAAYQQGFVTKKVDIQTLSQLYFESGAPYKSAKLLSESIESGVILENIKILNYLAQAWLGAKEIDKAIPVLTRAARLSKSGNFDARLAEIFLGSERWNAAINSANKAKEKGNLDNPGTVYIVLGMAYFNQNKFDASIKNFKRASREKQQRRMAEQWLRYANKEKEKFEQLQSALAVIGK